jgi:hypothetical protein
MSEVIKSLDGVSCQVQSQKFFEANKSLFCRAVWTNQDRWTGFLTSIGFLSYRASPSFLPFLSPSLFPSFLSLSFLLSFIAPSYIRWDYRMIPKFQTGLNSNPPNKNSDCQLLQSLIEILLSDQPPPATVRIAARRTAIECIYK